MLWLAVGSGFLAILDGFGAIAGRGGSSHEDLPCV